MHATTLTLVLQAIILVLQAVILVVLIYGRHVLTFSRDVILPWLVRIGTLLHDDYNPPP